MQPRRPGLKVVTRQGSAALYLRGTVRGLRVFESTGTDCPKTAEDIRITREGELLRSSVFGAAPVKVTFARAVNSYLDAEPRSAATSTFLRRLLRFWGPATACQDITQEKLDIAARALCRSTSKPATRLRNVVAPARAVLTHAARRGWCQMPAFETVGQGASRTDWLTPAEAEAMIAGSTKRLRHMRPILAFLFCTGARLGEAIALDWRDVDLQHGRAVLRDTKNGRDRQVDMPPRLVVELANLPHRTGRVLRDRAGRPYRLTSASRTVGYGGQVRASWAAALKAAGITKEVTPHHARHTWASWHYAVHKDLLLLKRDGGWSSVTQVERYAHLTPSGLAPSVCRFLGIVVAGEAAPRQAEALPG